MNNKAVIEQQGASDITPRAVKAYNKHVVTLGEDIQITMFAHGGKDLTFFLSPAIFLDQQKEVLGDMLIKAFHKLTEGNNEDT